MVTHLASYLNEEEREVDKRKEKTPSHVIGPGARTDEADVDLKVKNVETEN